MESSKMESNKNAKCESTSHRLIAVLDQVEMRLERLRRDTVRIEEERDSLLFTLDSVKHSDLLNDVTECDKDEIMQYAERILARAMTVEVAVRTDRDSQQEEALHQPDPSTGTDKNFETAILGCTLDDQKRVKKRLQGLQDYFAKLKLLRVSESRT